MTLSIRCLDHRDAGALFALVESNREFLTPWIEWVPMVKTAEDAERFLEVSVSVIGAWNDLQLIGCAGLQDNNGSLLYGALVSESDTGKGVALRMFDFVCGMLANNIDPDTLLCSVNSRNVRSTRYVQKCGFAPTGNVDGEMVEYCRKVGV